MGFQAYVISELEDLIVTNKIALMIKIATGGTEYHFVAGYIYWVLCSIFFVTIAALMTVFVAPAAMGSGVAEVMGMLNGINYEGAIGVKVLFVKVFGTLFAICAGLCIGKEGPLVHIGACIGVITCYMPFKWCEQL